jgi:hypothetical protein
MAFHRKAKPLMRRWTIRACYGVDASATRRDNAMANGSGSCREFAVFMMEAARHKGSARDL